MAEGGDEELSGMSKMKRTLSLANLYQPFINATSVSLSSFQMDTAVRYLPRISTTNMYTFDRFHETQSEVEINQSLSTKLRKLHRNHSKCLGYNATYSEPNMIDLSRTSNLNCCCVSSDCEKDTISSEIRKNCTHLYRVLEKQAQATTYKISDNFTPVRSSRKNGTGLHGNKMTHPQTKSCEKAISNKTIAKQSQLESIKDTPDVLAMASKNITWFKPKHILEPQSSFSRDKSETIFDATEGVDEHNRFNDSNEDIDSIVCKDEIKARTIGRRIVTASLIENADGSSTDDGMSESKCSASLLSEESVWIRRSSFANGLVMENKDFIDREINLTRPMESSVVVSRPPTILMLLVVLGALLNPILAPAGLYLLIKSKRARSKRRYYSAEQYVYKAGGIAIIGMFLTITSIVLLTLLPRSEVNMGKITESYTTTSYKSKNAANIYSAGERMRNILSQSNSYTRSRKRTTYRGTKRTTSPKQIYTKTRHSSHRFGNILIEKHEQPILPTEAAATTRAEHIKDFLREDVAKKPMHLTFRNRTVSVYFDPENNRTIVVHIPEFLQ